MIDLNHSVHSQCYGIEVGSPQTEEMNMNFRISDETKTSYKYLGKWSSISLISGILGVLILQAFVFLSQSISTFISDSSIHSLFWPLIGALITGGIIYRLAIDAAGEGIPSYIRGLTRQGGRLSLKVTFFKFFAALATLSTYGNGGVVGPLGRVSAGSSVAIVKLLKRLFKSVSQEDIRVSAICGMAAITGAIFHSSIGGGIFAVEIIQRRSLHYKDIFPAILSSSTAVFISKVMNWGSFYKLDTVNEFMDVSMVGWLLLFTIVVGFTGGLYTVTYQKIAHLTHRSQGHILPKVIVGSLIAFLITFAVHPDLLGTSKPVFAALFEGDIAGLTGRLSNLGHTSAILLVIIVVKILSNCITVGSGMSAGFTGPSALVGMLLGVAAALFLGVELGSPTYFAFVAAGFAGMLSSSMNVPLAAAILSIEIFGLEYSFPAAVSAVIGFQLMRSTTLYDYVYEEE